MTSQCIEFKTFKERLKHLGIGINTKYFKSVLAPSWWDQTMSQDASLTLQAALQTALRLRVKVESLIDASAPLPTVSIPCPAFKKKKNCTNAAIEKTTALLSHLAMVVCAQMEQQIDIIPAEQLRKQLLKRNDLIDLYVLLDFCWDNKIPVLFVDHFPDGSGWNKPTAVAFSNNGKYCIFLCKKNANQSYFLFELAHEIAHIMLGHLQNNSVIVDNELNRKNKELHETQADEYAILLLNGKTQPYDTPSILNAEDLAHAAISYGKRHHIDPGHIALNYAYDLGSRYYALGAAALKIIDQSTSGQPIELIRKKAFSNLDWDNFTDENLVFISELTGITGIV